MSAMRRDRLLERTTFTEWARHVEAGISSHAATPVCAVMRRGVPTARTDIGEDTLAEFMIEHECWELPVLDERGRLVGIVTAADLLRANVDAPELEEPTSPRLPEGFHAEPTPREVSLDMEPVPVTLLEDDPLGAALVEMAAARLDHAPVVAADRRLVGVLYVVDALAWLLDRHGFPGPGHLHH
jgi:CBS-domain-containing membrane protein